MNWTQNQQKSQTSAPWELSGVRHSEMTQLFLKFITIFSPLLPLGSVKKRFYLGQMTQMLVVGVGWSKTSLTIILG